MTTSSPSDRAFSLDGSELRVLTINGGSSSIKFALFEAGYPPKRCLAGAIERIGLADTILRATGSDFPDVKQPLAASSLSEAIAELLDWLDGIGELRRVSAVGHRLVHGGSFYTEPQMVTAELIEDLQKASTFAPAHLPSEIRIIQALDRRLTGVPQIVCFDTAFHRDLPEAAYLLPIPRRYQTLGVRRYGFHGLSYASLIDAFERLAGTSAAQGRIILAHLGSGASMAAVHGGRSVDTTMGLTPSGGLVMGTRTGDIDPGVLVHISRLDGLSTDQLEDLVTRQAGLLGLSETSSDMRDLLALQATDPRAASAVDVFCYQARKWVGSLAAALGGLDAIVFSGGIGEHAPEVRARVCHGLEFLGVQLDPAANAANAPVISTPSSSVDVRVIPADEELIIARTVFGFSGSDAKPSEPTSVSDQHASHAISDKQVAMLDAYWRAANYLSVGQIYLLDNALLKEPLGIEHIKPRLLGHWGTSPGLNMIYVHLNRVIVAQDLHVLFITGPGHGGPSVVAHCYLESTYTEVYPTITQDAAGLNRLFRQFSFPGGIPSHVAPETPGSIHEGGELGYALSHAFGAAFDNPDLIVAAVVGDGEAETGPLATSWHSNKFLNPATDGAVLPILHLNGYKIANPTILARIPKDELKKLFEGYGYKPYFVEGHEPDKVHRELAAVMDIVTAEIKQIWFDARTNGIQIRPTWPMIVLRTPKGWTCPAEIDGKKCEDYWRSHQVPMGDMDKPGHVEVLEKWLKSYRPEDLFDETGKLKPDIAELAPKGELRMSANPHANGGLFLEDLRMPDYRNYAVEVTSPGAVNAEATREMGRFLRDVMKLNLDCKNFRLFSPDENNSNRWQDVLDVTNRAWMAERYDTDDKLAPNGRVMEMLSEHQCQGWLEGYLLTGRHGFFSCYEAFIHIIDSMFNQHAKWLKVCNQIPWRKPIASLNYLLSSHVWRQDHNGFSHQDPGFLDHVANKKAEVIRIYLPPDANTLLSVTDHCLRSRNYVNVVVAGKQPSPQWLTMAEAEKHCAAGLGIWEWASNDDGSEPDVVMACCGDVPTLETLAAVDLLRQHLPEVKVRVVNVVNLMKLSPHKEHPHGLTDEEFDAIFTTDRQIIFAFHGYPSLIHQLTYSRTNHGNLHVRGYKEEGTTTTPFDMVVMNDMDRFHLVMDVIDRVPGLTVLAGDVRRAMIDKRTEHKWYIAVHGEDMPEISDWRWRGIASCESRSKFV